MAGKRPPALDMSLVDTTETYSVMVFDSSVDFEGYTLVVPPSPKDPRIDHVVKPTMIDSLWEYIEGDRSQELIKFVEESCQSVKATVTIMAIDTKDVMEIDPPKLEEVEHILADRNVVVFVLTPRLRMWFTSLGVYFALNSKKLSIDVPIIHLTATDDMDSLEWTTFLDHGNETEFEISRSKTLIRGWTMKGILRGTQGLEEEFSDLDIHLPNPSFIVATQPWTEIIESIDSDFEEPTPVQDVVRIIHKKTQTLGDKPHRSWKEIRLYNRLLFLEVLLKRLDAKSRIVFWDKCRSEGSNYSLSWKFGAFLASCNYHKQSKIRTYTALPTLATRSGTDAPPPHPPPIERGVEK